MTPYDKKIAAIEAKKKALETEIEILKNKRSLEIAAAVSQIDFLNEKDLFTIIGALLHLENNPSKEQEEAWHDAGKKFWRTHKASLDPLSFSSDQKKGAAPSKTHKNESHPKKKKG